MPAASAFLTSRTLALALNGTLLFVGMFSVLGFVPTSTHQSPFFRFLPMIAPVLTILFLAPSRRNRLAASVALFFNALAFVALAYFLYRVLGQTGELGSPLLLVLMLVLIVIPLISGLSIGAHWPVARNRNLEQVGRK